MSETNIKRLYRIGGIAALIQLAAILASIVIAVGLGPRPTSAAEFFAIQQSNPLAALLRGDVVLMVFLLGAYVGTFPALWWNLRHVNPIAATFATLFTLIVVTLSFSGEATFALLHYFVWFPMLARDLFRLTQGSSHTRTQAHGNHRPAHG
jgi:ribose/xylose/arabinose/galactoside ABC-type transport system permease subunit